MSMRRTTLVAVTMSWAFLGSAEAQEAGETLQRAVALSDSGEWEQTVTVLEQILDRGGLSQVEQMIARKLLGLTCISLGRRDQAVAIYKDMVRHDASLDMTVLDEKVPTDAIRCLGQAVIEVRRDEIARRREHLRQVSRRGAFLRSTILPGWGQRYQGSTGRGYLMAGLTVAAATYATIAQRVYWQARRQYRHAPKGSDFDALFDRSQQKGEGANRAWRLMGGIWLLNVVDAVLQGPNLAGPDMAVTMPATHDGAQLAYRRRF